MLCSDAEIGSGKLTILLSVLMRKQMILTIFIIAGTFGAEAELQFLPVQIGRASCRERVYVLV